MHASIRVVPVPPRALYFANIRYGLFKSLYGFMRFDCFISKIFNINPKVICKRESKEFGQLW